MKKYASLQTRIMAMAVCMVFSIKLTAQTYSQSTGTNTVTGQTYASTTADLSAVKVTGGTFTMNTCSVTKSGNTSSSDNSSFYGLNAAVLSSGSSSTINMTGGTISTSASGANAIVAYGGSVNVSDVTITCTGQYSRGIHATNGGTINATNLTATTSGANSSVIATDRGGGTVTVTGGSFNVSGTDAAVLYSTGTVSASGITGGSTKGEIAVVEGSNSMTITNNCTLTSGSSSRGILILQSGSGDATGKIGTFNMIGGSLQSTESNAPLFEVVTNSTGNITLNGVSTTIASGILMKVDYNTRWSTNGATGNLYLNGSTTYSGNIVADSYSNASVNILTGATLTGAINNANTAKLVALTLDATSTWTLTANSYINGLISNPGISGTSVANITGNGYHIYYTESTNAALGGLTYSLVGGGYLMPVSGTVLAEVGAESFDWSLSSNPAKDELQMKLVLNNASTVNASIVDLFGRTIRQHSFGSLSQGAHLLKLNENDLPAGVYLLSIQVTNEQNVVTRMKKILKN